MSDDDVPASGLLAGLVRQARVIVVCGTGGVGKTTVVAALGVGAACAGRRVVVLTIDPARRLADTLGLSGLTNDPTPVDLDGLAGFGGSAGRRGVRAIASATGTEGAGSLHALMLDAKATFDALVRREASTPERAEQILANRFYRNISGTLSGTHEYMASEKLVELVEAADDGAYDLIVIDTPPASNAVEFLTAPRRLTRLLDNRMFRLVMAPARTGMRIVGTAAQVVLRQVGKVVGGDVVADAVEFFQVFDGMEAGFRARSQKALDVLHDRHTTWVLVGSPEPASVHEAVTFAGRLDDLGVALRAVVTNRLCPDFGPAPSGPDPGCPDDGLRALADEARRYEARRARELASLEPLRERLPEAVFVEGVERPGAALDLDGLAALAAELGVGRSSPRGRVR